MEIIQGFIIKYITKLDCNWKNLINFLNKNNSTLFQDFVYTNRLVYMNIICGLDVYARQLVNTKFQVYIFLEFVFYQ